MVSTAGKGRKREREGGTDIYVTFGLVLPKLLKGCHVCACVLRLKGSSKVGMLEQVIIELTFALKQGLAA